MFEDKEQEAITLMIKMLEDSGWKYPEIINYILARIYCMPDLPNLKPHTIHKTRKDIDEHDEMSMTLLAEHLGVDLYIAMEIARWAVSRPKPKSLEPKVEDLEKILCDKVFIKTDETPEKVLLVKGGTKDGKGIEIGLSKTAAKEYAAAIVNYLKGR